MPARAARGAAEATQVLEAAEVLDAHEAANALPSGAASGAAAAAEGPSASNAADGEGGPAVFSGLVCGGVGEAAGFLSIDWVREGMRRAFGFEPWPGTLNLRMEGADWQRWRARLMAHPAIILEPAPGFCPARCFAVRLADRIDAAIVFPDVPGYPEDKLEIVAPLHLRTALSLRDGDRLRVQVQPAAAA